MIDLFGPHHVSTADDERISEIEQAFEVVRGRQIHLFLASLISRDHLRFAEIDRCKLQPM